LVLTDFLWSTKGATCMHCVGRDEFQMIQNYL
jgi:hypothetical protein